MLPDPHRLVLASAVPESFTPTELEAIVRAALADARGAYALARANLLAGPAWTLVEHVAERVADRGGLTDGIDAALRTEWASAQYAVAVVHSMARKQLVALAEPLALEGIGALLFGGLDSLTRFYASPRLRVFGEIELLVAIDDSDRIDAVLRDVAYTPEAGSADPVRYEHPQWPLAVHVHRRVPFGGEGVGPLFAAAQPFPDPSCDFACACSPDALVVCALRAAACWVDGSADQRLHRVIELGGLVSVLDMVAWLQREGDADRDEVVARAELQAAGLALARALRLASDLAPSGVPGWARELAAAAQR